MKDTLKQKRFKKNGIIAIVSVLLSIALYILGRFNYLFIEEGEVQVHFIDVGQGDAALILTETGSVLIDAGTTESREKVAAYVKMYTDTLDYMILSHPHEDHIGGASDVFDSVSVKNVIMPDYTADSAAFDRTLNSIEDENCKVYPAERGDFYAIDDLKMEIMSPIPDKDYEDTNNVSAVVKVTYGNTSFLFTGDAEKYVEDDLLDLDTYLDSDVLKVGHHGSSTSSSEEFIEAVSPEIAVISCGDGNSYGHPHYEVTDILNKNNSEILRTDKLGNIVLISDGNNITVG